jgi:hypothetical protein
MVILKKCATINRHCNRKVARKKSTSAQKTTHHRAAFSFKTFTDSHELYAAHLFTEAIIIEDNK